METDNFEDLIEKCSCCPSESDKPSINLALCTIIIVREMPNSANWTPSRMSTAAWFDFQFMRAQLAAKPKPLQE